MKLIINNEIFYIKKNIYIYIKRVNFFLTFFSSKNKIILNCIKNLQKKNLFMETVIMTKNYTILSNFLSFILSIMFYYK